MDLCFTDSRFLWLLIPAAMGLAVMRRGIRLWQAAAALTLILAAAGPVLVRNGQAEVRVIRETDGCPSETLAEAGASLRHGGTIEFHSSFHEKSGSIERAAANLAGRGIVVEACPQGAAVPAEPVLRDLHYQPVIGAGEPWEIELELSVPKGSQADLVLREHGRILFRRKTVFSKTGRARLKLSCIFKKPGEYLPVLDLNGKKAAELAVRVEKPYPALLISADPVREGAALRSLLNGAAAVTEWKAGMDFSPYPLIVIGERGGYALNQAKMRKLAESVRNGNGLLIFTGRDAPFPPGSLPSELENILPVRYTGRKQDRTPTTALVIIIDTSGSMTGTRIALARETARLALEKLRDCDLAGIVEFHGRRRWAAPLQSAANQLEMRRALNRLNAGGGTIILPAVREAFYALRNADTRLKHVLIITDGGVEQGDFEGLLRRMARYGITVSTVLTGNGQSPFLEQLALWGGGRYYTASSRFALPELIFRQTGSKSLPPYREGKFPLEIRSVLPLTAGLPGDLTADGVLETVLNPGADDLIRADGLPLIAGKRTGSGSVVSVNTEMDGPGVKTLRSDQAFSGMLAALARSLSDPARRMPFAVRNYSKLQEIHLEIDAMRPWKKLHLNLNDREDFILFPDANGSFHFRRSGMKPGINRFSIREPDQSGSGYRFRIVSRCAPGGGGTEADLETAERINRRSARIERGKPAPEQIGLRWICGLLFIVFFLMEILLRRLPGSRAAGVGLLILCWTLPGGEYEDSLRTGLLNGDRAAGAFRKAAQAARNPSDRRFALLLEIETARRNGKIEDLLKEWGNNHAADPEQLELMLCELEDSGRIEAALNLLLSSAGHADRRFTPQLIRLAEKCGKKDLIRKLSGQKMHDAPDQPVWLNAAVRLELLAGNRSEAIRLYDERIRRENDPDRLSAIAEAAENSALYSCADRALERLETLPDVNRYSIRFRRMDLTVGAGRPGDALKQAQQLASESDLPESVLMSLADRCERLGDPETALKIYRRIPGEESLIRQAMLFSSQGRISEAAECWKKILTDSDNEMRAVQAMERIIALYQTGKQLESLCLDLEKKAERSASPRLRLFCCRALLAAGKRDRLWSFLDRFGTAELKLKFLLEARQYTEAAGLLEKQLENHPEKREELLRSLTVLAIESKDFKLAEKTAAELLKTASDRVAALYFTAGVYTLLNQPRKAVEIYDECILLAPDQIELLLLRANAQKAAGEKEKALTFFREKLRDRKVSHDLFGVLVDGMLNLEAGRDDLQETLKLTLKRLRENPDMLFYYRLAEDLAEETGDQALWRKLQLLQLAAAPERRSLLLRGLYEEACQRNAGEEAFYYARLLTGWNEIYTPELYQSLARCLTDHGCFTVAERCVRQADAAENTTRNLFSLIQVCLDSGRTEDGARIVRELLSLMPDSAEYRICYASVLERQGKYLEAGEENLKALTMLASRQAADLRGGKGNSRTAFEKSIRPLLNAFANQYFIHRGHFEARLNSLIRQSRPAARKLIWMPLMQRIGNLRKLPPEQRRIRAYSIRNAGIPLEKELAFLPDGEAVKKFRDAFGKIPAKQRGAHLGRLIGKLSSDPGPELTAAIREEVRKAKLSNFRPAWINQPCALEIKRYYANQMLRQHPDSIPAMTLLAQLRWLSGQTGPARLLAGEVFDRFLNSKNLTFQDVRCLESLNLVFAAGEGEPAAKGAALREDWLRSLESDRKLLGETPQRVLLTVLLLEGSGKADETFDQLIRLWKNGVRTMLVFRKLESLAVRTCRYREWLDTIAAYESKESSVQISAARRLVQLYREYGMADHARSKMNLLPPILEKRERLLLEHNVLPERKFAAALSSFLIDQCRSSSYIGLYSDNFGMDGLKGRMIRGVMRPNLLPSLTVKNPELSRTLTYLISGTPVTDRGFATLLETWRNLPDNADIRIPAGEQTSPQLLALKAAGGHPLTSGESGLLRKIVLHSGVAEDTAMLLLELLPEKERAAAAYDLGMKNAADPYHMRRNRRKLIAAVPPSRRETLLRQWAKQSGPESGQKFELLYLCRIYAPDVFPGLQKELIRGEVFPMNSECRLLYGKEEPAKRLRNFFISSEQFPDWEKLLAFDEGKALISVVEKALEDALRDHLMTSDRLVRHYALLAVCDPVRKAHWLACAARHDTVPGEASLWLLDALEKTPGWRTQYEKLRKAGRLSPVRMKTYGNNKTPTQKP